MRGAVIDLGSNSFKLFLAEQKKDCLMVHTELAEVTRLGEGIVHTNKLSSQAIRRSLEVLKKYAEEISRFNPDKMVMLGTSALRLATNRNLFISQAEKILKSKVQIVSERGEGELVYAGLLSHPKWRSKSENTKNAKQIVQLDLGGGSLEIVGGKGTDISFVHSLPIGCVRLRDMFLKNQPLEPSELIRAMLHLNEKLLPVQKKLINYSNALWVATGGSATMLAAVIDALKLKNRTSKIKKENLKQLEEGCLLTLNELEELFNTVSSMTLDEICALPSIPKNRADLAASALLVYITLMRISSVSKLHISWRGLRYGAWSRWICPEPFNHLKMLKQ